MLNQRYAIYNPLPKIGANTVTDIRIKVLALKYKNGWLGNMKCIRLFYYHNFGHSLQQRK